MPALVSGLLQQCYEASSTCWLFYALPWCWPGSSPYGASSSPSQKQQCPHLFSTSATSWEAKLAGAGGHRAENCAADLILGRAVRWCGGRVSISLGSSHTTLTMVITRVTYSMPAFYWTKSMKVERCWFENIYKNGTRARVADNFPGLSSMCCHVTLNLVLPNVLWLPSLQANLSLVKGL